MQTSSTQAQGASGGGNTGAGGAATMLDGILEIRGADRSDNPGGYIVQDADAIPRCRHWAIVWCESFTIPADKSHRDSRLWTDDETVGISVYEFFPKKTDWESAVARAFNGPVKFRAIEVTPVTLSIKMDTPVVMR